MKDKLIFELESYVPFNEQEERDRILILKSLKTFDDIFYRENSLAHMTASSWIVNDDMSKVIMAYHNIYNSWSWLGGHADGCEDLIKVAIKEAKEESGIKTVVPYSDKIFSIESLTVDGHIKRGKYVSSHLHLNVTYLLKADENELLTIKDDENSGVKWFTLDDAVESSTEPWFKEHVYSKLNLKLRSMK